MTIRILPTSLAAMLLLTIGLPLAAEGKAPAAPARAKNKLKPVDINSAPKNEMAFMLGIPEDLAAKIIAGRPYRSKAHLFTRNIVSMDVYAKIKDKVVAKQSGPVR
jgi:DNA uptake protein ComE-like DNA-binding protein